MKMKKTWEVPVILVQQFEANEYVAACWGVGCNTAEANNYEQTHYYKNNQTWYQFGCSHDDAHCGNSSNQVIFDYDNDGIGDAMIETGTSGLGDLTCTIYTDGSYSVTRPVSGVEIGEVIYWTTSASDGRVWHHSGTVTATAVGHPNRS